MSASTAGPETKVRSNQLVHSGLQLSVALSMVATLAVLAGIYAVSMMAVHDPVLDAGSAATRRMGYLVSGLYFLLAACTTLIVGVRVTQRIAGPARLIENAVRGMRKGEYEHRLSLRENDHLKSLASEVEGLRSELLAQKEQHASQARSITDALVQEDLNLVRRLTQDLASELQQAGRAGLVGESAAAPEVSEHA